MTSSLKDTFSTSNSWVSRAGVIVGYKPEDTMKSFLFNQNNRHCINFDENEMSILKLPQSEIEKALDFLSSDSDSESSSITKITVKHTSDISINEEKLKMSKNPKSGSDVEICNTNNHSDAECTSADISNDFGDKISSIEQNKSFEEILEEKLKEEQINKSKTQRDNLKPDNGTKPKFSFLRKNAGRAAWCSNTRPSRDDDCALESLKSIRSQSNDTQRGRKLFDVSQNSNNKNNEKQRVPVRRMKSLNNVHVTKQPDVTKTNRSRKNGKQGQKTVHFAAACFIGSEPEIENVTVTQVNQKAPEIEDNSILSSDDNQEHDKDLVEFELLEQIANVSISSSVASSIAMYDEENLRAKLQKFKSAKPPLNYSQDKYYDSQRIQPFETNKHSTTIERNFHNLSTCEERTENVTNSFDSDLGDESDDNSQNTSINTTTLSEFKEPKPPISNNFIIHPEKMQVFTRKVAKHKEQSKSVAQESEEEIEENPFQLESNTCPTIPSKSLHVDWSFADPFHLSDSSCDEAEHQKKTEKPISKPNMEMCPLYPIITVDKQQSNPENNIAMQSAKLKQWVQLLENEVKRFKSENEEIEKLKKEKEDGLKRLEEEMKVFKKFKDDEINKFEEYKQNELKKLKKERKVFDDYQEAMKNMPNKKDRQDIENLKSEIDALKEELSSKENRWQAANSRLKQKVDQLESENSELHSRIHSLEQKRLHLQAQLVSNTNQKPKHENNVSKPKLTVTSVSQAVSMKHSNIPLNSLPKEDNNNNKCVSNPSKINIQAKKNSSKIVNSNLNKSQKPIKNVSNPFALENNGMDIRGSAASDYYTGEEENGSVDLNKQKTFLKNKCSDSELTAFQIPDIPSSAKIDHSNEIIKDEIHHPDGIIERIYMSGSVDITYPNGSLKQISPDNKFIVVHLYNGDIKQTTPDGRVIYYYAQDQSTQTTYPNGKEEILYQNGHKETMHPSGIREINFPDKSVKILHPDSTEETFLPNGLVIRINKTGDKEILLPNGQKEIHSNGIKKRIYPDGTTKTVYLDGRQETFYASGRMRVKDKNGNLILDQYIQKANLLTSSS